MIIGDLVDSVRPDCAASDILIEFRVREDGYFRCSGRLFTRLDSARCELHRPICAVWKSFERT